MTIYFLMKNVKGSEYFSALSWQTALWGFYFQWLLGPHEGKLRWLKETKWENVHRFINIHPVSYMWNPVMYSDGTTEPPGFPLITKKTSCLSDQVRWSSGSIFWNLESFLSKEKPKRSDVNFPVIMSLFCQCAVWVLASVGHRSPGRLQPLSRKD